MTEEQRPPTAAPGWYPHPTMAGTQAYWDGERWTDHVAPAQPVATVSGDATNAAAKLFLLLAAAAAIVLVLVIAGAVVRG